MARLLILALPFRLLARVLGRSRTPARPPAAEHRLRTIRWSLNAASRRAPWRCKCLERAVAGAFLLRVRRLPATIFLGVARTAPGAELLAHAWLRCGDFSVVGEEGSVEDYVVVACFPPTPRESRRA